MTTIETDISKYRVMWIMILYDLPTSTKKEQRTAAAFHKNIIKNGFAMFQFSAYIKHCGSTETADVYMRHLEKLIPNNGDVCYFSLTDKQFASMKIFRGKKTVEIESHYVQLELF